MSIFVNTYISIMLAQHIYFLGVDVGSSWDSCELPHQPLTEVSLPLTKGRLSQNPRRSYLT